jgi:outer membrane lipoprotein-sorting protein
VALHPILRRLRVFLRSLAIVALFAAAVVLAPAGAQKRSQPSHQPKALDIVEKRYAGLKAISQTITGTMEISARGDTAKATIDGRMIAARPNKFRLELTVNFFGEDRHVVMLSDGHRLIEYDPDDHAYTEQPLGALAANMDKLAYWFSSRTGDISVPLFIAAGHKPTGKDTTTYVVSSGSIEGQPVTVVTVKGAFGGAGTGVMKLYCDTKEGVVRRFAVSTPLPQSKGGISATLNLVSNYVDINTEPDLGSDAFEFTPPDDARHVPAVAPILARTIPAAK